jgi:hypothetical protein
MSERANIDRAPSPTSDPRLAHAPKNGCAACRADFTSLRLFEGHRVGDHPLERPEHENGRRCLATEELRAKGWAQEDQGRWYDPAGRIETRGYFEKAAEPCPEGPKSLLGAEEAV